MNVIARLFILGCADEAPFPIRAGIEAYWNRHPNPGGASRARAHSYSPDGMSGSATRRLDHVGIERQRQHAPSSSQGKNPPPSGFAQEPRKTLAVLNATSARGGDEPCG